MTEHRQLAEILADEAQPYGHCEVCRRPLCGYDGSCHTCEDWMC